MFMRISRIFTLSLVVISAVSYAGEWVVAFVLDSPACTLGKTPCYQGPALTFLEFIYQFDVPRIFFLMPVVDLFAALILLVRPRRTYFILALLAWASMLVQLFSKFGFGLNFNLGNGYGLHLFAIGMLFLLSLPLALDEQMRLNPGWDSTTFTRWLSPG
ncbi:MAG: hypothetical protein JXB38_08095 [Anaerolineales bacterium]|nr:hypothetical protein [Anaerolineales bacterium]